MTVWLKVSETAEYSKFSQDVIRAAIKAGDLPSYAPGPGGRNIILKAEEVDAWIESRPYVPKSAAS